MLRAGSGRGPFARALVHSDAFSPLSLFAASEKGGWYDISDLSTLFQDSSRTVAAGVGDPVGGIADKSGNGNHLGASGTARPVLQQDGNGHYYLDFDGVDDALTCAAVPTGGSAHAVIFLATAGASGTDRRICSIGTADGGSWSRYLTGSYVHYLEGSGGLTPNVSSPGSGGTNPYISTVICDLSKGDDPIADLALRARGNLSAENSSGSSGPGAGTFQSATAYLGTSIISMTNYFQGRVYGWIFRYASTDTATQDEIIGWINERCGAY